MSFRLRKGAPASSPYRSQSMNPTSETGDTPLLLLCRSDATPATLHARRRQCPACVAALPTNTRGRRRGRGRAGILHSPRAGLRRAGRGRTDAARARSPFCKIDTGHPRAGLGEKLMICAKADADLQDITATRGGSVGERRDIGLELIPSSTVRLVAGLVPRCKVPILATGAGIPEVVHLTESIGHRHLMPSGQRWVLSHPVGSLVAAAHVSIAA